MLPAEGLSDTSIAARMGLERAAVWKERKRCADGAPCTAINSRDRNGNAQIVTYSRQLENGDWIISRGQSCTNMEGRPQGRSQRKPANLASAPTVNNLRQSHS